MSDIYNTGGTLSGSPLQGQMVLNPGIGKGEHLIYNREPSYQGQSILETSGDLSGRFSQITYYTA